MGAEKIIYITPVAIETMIATAVNRAVSQRLYSLEEAALMLNSTPRHLEDTKHEVGFVKVGRKTKFKGEDIQSFIDRNYVKSIGA